MVSRASQSGQPSELSSPLSSLSSSLSSSSRAAELLNSIPASSRTLPVPVDVDFPFSTSTPSRAGGGLGRGDQPRPSLSTFSPSDFIHHPPTTHLDTNISVDPSEDEDLFDLGKAYFDAHELDRCAWTLRECTTGKAAFLRLYAKFLVSAPDQTGTIYHTVVSDPRSFSCLAECGQADARRPPLGDGSVLPPVVARFGPAYQLG